MRMLFEGPMVTYTFLGLDPQCCTIHYSPSWMWAACGIQWEGVLLGLGRVCGTCESICVNSKPGLDGCSVIFYSLWGLSPVFQVKVCNSEWFNCWDVSLCFLHWKQFLLSNICRISCSKTYMSLAAVGSFYALENSAWLIVWEVYENDII